MQTYFEEQQAKLRQPMRKYQFDALLKIYIGLGDLVDMNRVGRENQEITFRTFWNYRE